MTKHWAKMPYQSYRFSGADTHDFLQGQLTQDINAIDENNCQYGAYCNHQGAMYANFLITKAGNDVVLRLHESQSEPVLRRLKMFVLRADVNIELIDATHVGMNKAAAAAFCVSVQAALPEAFKAIHTDDFSLMALPGDYFELRTKKTDILAKIESQSSLSAAHIETLRITSGNFHIYPETSELLLPQETPLETWGGISYTKGCYVGQEIIARSKYRGKIRKGLATATINSTTDIPLSGEVLCDERNVGVVIESFSADSSCVCLASIKLLTDSSDCRVVDSTASFEFI